jgi:type II secretion system protein N
MRLPRLRLPGIPAGWFSDIGGRPLLLYAGYTATLFIVFLIVTFPHDIIVRRVLQRVQNPTVAVDISGARFAWLRGYELEGVRVAALPMREGVPPLVELTRLRVRPDYRGLVKGDLSTLILSGELYGGSANGFMSSHDGTLAGSLEWSGLELRRYHGITTWLDEGQLSGTIGGSWSIAYARGDPTSMEGGGDLTLSRAALAGGKVQGFKVPDLQVTEAKAKVTLKVNRLDLPEFSATGSELELQANGNVTLKEPLDESLLNIRVTLQKVPEGYKPFLAFLPRRGAKSDTMPVVFSLSGTLGHPLVR